MQDHKGVVLYIGKALKLRDRVSSYFQCNVDLGPRKQPMLDLIHDFDIVPCQSEWEAVLAEARLIKDTHPRFNTMMRDDKTWPYLAITIREDFPGVYITRSPNDERFRGARILGPFRSPGALREAMQRLAREGTLRILPRAGAIVSEIDVSDQFKLIEIRRGIERVMARAFHELGAAAKRYGCDFRSAAFALAAMRVAHATELRGI